jgi:hypothetical protein
MPSLFRSTPRSLVLRMANPYGDDRQGSPDRARRRWGSARWSAHDSNGATRASSGRRRHRSAVRSSEWDSSASTQVSSAPGASRTRLGACILVRMRRLALVFALATAATVGAQNPPPSFEVASIKLNTTVRPPLNSVDLNFLNAVASGTSNGRFTMRGLAAVPPRLLIQLAYHGSSSAQEASLLRASAWRGGAPRRRTSRRVRSAAYFAGATVS